MGNTNTGTFLGASTRQHGIATLAFFVMFASVIGGVGLSQPAAAQTADPITTRQGLQDAVAGIDQVIEISSLTLDGNPIVIDRDVTIQGVGELAEGSTVTVAKSGGNVAGQAFVVESGSVTFRNLAITGADTRNKGGAISVSAGATVMLEDVYLHGNSAGEGGALYNGGTTTIIGSTVDGNTAAQKGGGIESDGTITIVNSTLTGNIGKGGGAISVAGTAALSFVTIVSNTSTNKIGAGILRNGGTVAVKNAIVANNVDQSGGFHDCSGSPDFESVLLSSDQGCNPKGTFLVVANVMFGALDYYGGATKTLPLIDNPDGTLHPAVGLAIDCADLSGTPMTVDQRDVARPQGEACDAGAYERDQTPPVVTATATPGANSAGWNHDPVTVTLGADEPATVEYSLDGGTTWNLYSEPITVSSEGNTTVSYRATDVDGNESKVGTLDLKLDLTDPTVEVSQKDGLSEGDIDVTLTASDVPSGVASIWYQIDNGHPGTVTEKNPVTITVTDVGDTTISYSATDVAGNTSNTETVTVTIEPLSLEVTLSASASSIEVGAVTVPLQNIPQAIRAAEGTDTTTASTPLSAIPLSAIPLSAIDIDAIPLSAIPLSAIPLSAIPLSAIDVNGAPLSAIPLSAIPLSAIPLSAIPLSAIPLSAIPLTDTPLSAIPLSAILLSDIGTDLLSDGETGLDQSLEALLQGSPLADTPAQSLTFGDLIASPLSAIDFAASPLSAIPLSAIPLSAITLEDICISGCDGNLGQVTQFAGTATIGHVIGLDDVDLASTPLSAIPLSAIALGTVPLSAIPLSAIDATGNTLTDLDAWCELLGAGLCSDLGITSTVDNNVSLMTLALAGVPLSAIPLSAIELSELPLSAIPLSAIPLSAITWASTPLSAIPLSAITVEGICISGCDGTLGDVTEFADTATIGLLDGAIPAGYSLADLLYGILGSGSIPWEDLDLDASRLPDAADPKQPNFTYSIGIEVGGARTAAVDVALDLPDGFVPAYDISAPQLDGADTPRPDETDGVLTFTGLSLSPGPHTVTVPMRAGITLGAAQASVTVSSSGVTAGPATASVNVVEAGEGGGIPVISNGNLELSHISTSGDIDLYQFSVDSALAGASADILLSNLPEDFDLVLYGPKLQDPLRGEPRVGYGTIEDFRYDLDPDDDALDPDALEDVPNTPPGSSVLHAVSATRSTNDEKIETGTLREGTYYLQVSSYNGASSNNPFALRVRIQGSSLGPCSVGALRSGASPTHSLPASYPDGLNTIFLYNSAWMTDTYGASNAVFGALNGVSGASWTDLGVTAAAVPVDADPDVWNALQAWDADRCDPLAPNDVVREIGGLIDSIRSLHPTLENVVLVGDDSQIPFARIPDGVSVSNETEHGRTIEADGELKRALSGGYYFSDDPYGTSRGISVADHEFFVPELAVGRLVETPEEIAGLMTDFVGFGGVLDPDTADGTFAAATGYDFLSDGTVEVVAGLGDGGFTVDVLNNETWTRSDLIALLSGNALTAASINAHFDESRALPALGNATGDESDLFTVTDLPTGLTRTMLFSMGCHSGLSVSDIQIGTPTTDWAQALSGSSNLWAANTGYGYGDTQVVAYSEQISAYFAENLATMSVGQAWVAAKQRFASQLFTLTPYHEKVSQEFVFYGLPMFKAFDEPVTAALAETTSDSGPTVVNDPFGDGVVAPVGIDLAIGPSTGPDVLNQVTTTEGSYFEVDGETLMVRGRPIQPLTGIDVTRPDGSGGVVAEAGGALITGLTGKQVKGFDPLVFDPVIDLGDAENPSRQTGTRFESGDATFPAGLQQVVSYVDETGQPRQRLLIAPGRFKSEGSVQELFTSVDALVHYRDPASTDFDAPFIRESLGRYGAGIAHFEVDVVGDGPVGGDDVERVYVLFRPKGATGPTTWLGVDLARVPDTNTWLGGRPVAPFTATDYEFFVQAVDGNANVASATSKGVNFLTVQPSSDTNITLTVSGATLTGSGWYDGPLTATAKTTEGATITSYTLDGVSGAGSQTDTQSIEIKGDGGHLLAVNDSEGRRGILFVAIDQTDPVVSASLEPDSDGGWIGTQSTVTITGSDLFGSGVVSIEYQRDGVSEWTTVAGDTASFTVDTTTTISYRATDGVGRVSEVGTLTVQIDTVPPVVTPSASPTPNAAGWISQAASVTLVADDENRSGVFSIEYSLDSGSTWNPYSAAITVSSEGETTITYRATDAVGNTSTPAEITVKVDAVAPTVTIRSPEAIEYSVGASVIADYKCEDATSGVVSCDGTVANGAEVDTSTAGTFTFTVDGTDIAGNTATATVEYTVVDNIPPTIDVTSPVDGTLYPLGTVLTANFTCADNSGAVDCTGTIDGVPIGTGDSIPTDTADTHVLTVKATDGAGNTVTKSVSFAVGYHVCLLYDPEQEQPAGGAQAIKLQICDAAGANLSKAPITVTAVSLVSDPDGNVELDPQDSGGANSQPTFEFRYDPKLKGYIYNLKQDPSLAPGSYILRFTVDGTLDYLYDAPFRIK